MVTARVWQGWEKHAPILVPCYTGWNTVYEKEEQSCTSGPNQWLEPKSIKQVPYLELGSIDFTSANQSMKKFHQDAPEHEPVEESETVEASKRIQHCTAF